MIVIRDTTPILFEETFVFLKEEHERIEFKISNTETGEKLTERTEESFERFELVEDIDRRNNLGRIFSGKVKYLMIERPSIESMFVRARGPVTRNRIDT